MNDRIDIDGVARRRHGEALTHVSPRVQAQLQQRRRTALAGRAPGARVTSMHRFGWAGAAAFTAVFAIAIGMQWSLPGAPQGGAAAPAPVTTAAMDDGASAGDVALDENPDFYLWLGSNDAQAFAME